MKKFYSLITFLLFFLNLFPSDFYGEIENSMRINFLQGYSFYDYSLLDLKYDRWMGDRIKFYLDVQVQTDLLPLLKRTEDLSFADNFYNSDFRIYETSLFLKRFPFDFVDLTFGKTYYNPGKGFVVSPVDIINPDDLSDPLKMDRKLTKGLFIVEMYSKIFNLNIIYSPFFTPTLLPSGYIDYSEYLGGVNVKDSLIFPEDIAKSSELFLFMIKDFNNLQTSFFYGYSRSRTPLAKNVKIIMNSSFSAIADLQLWFPRVHNFGFTFSTVLKDFGIWGDLCGNFVSEKNFKIDMSDIGRGTVDTFNFKEKFFFNFLAGIDYTLFSNYYMTFQYVHGMRGVYGEENINDYFFFGSRINLLGGKIVFEPLNFAYEIVNWKNLKNEGGLLLNPKITFDFIDNFSFGVSFYYIKATKNSYFDKIDKKDCVEFTTKIFF